MLTLPALFTGATVRVRDGAIEVSGGALGRWFSRLPPPFGFHAITFGHLIFAVDEAKLARCRAHEHVHVRQYERWGVLFFALYLGSSLFEGLRGRDFYRDNCFEREARGETDVRRHRV